MKVELTIQELALHGFAARERYAIAEAVQKELERLIVRHGWPEIAAHGSDIPALDGGEFCMAATGRPQATGAHIARLVYGALNGATCPEHTMKPLRKG